MRNNTDGSRRRMGWTVQSNKHSGTTVHVVKYHAGLVDRASKCIMIKKFDIC